VASRPLTGSHRVGSVGRTAQMSVLLIRHGHAGTRQEWDGEDHLRPLSARGKREAGS
jgi:hypothetical protein